MLRHSLRPLRAVGRRLRLQAPALAHQIAYTTRIEPRAVYGATVTIEEGVRVFRPFRPSSMSSSIPAARHPLSLGYYTYDDPNMDPRFTRNRKRSWRQQRLGRPRRRRLVLAAVT